ncbi:MAG: carboxymuconolactone decarboxylase family protein [Gemmatimonadales bacterium]
MSSRFDYANVAPGVYDAMDRLDGYIGGCGLEESLIHLVRLRASLGEAEQRLYSLDAWRECPYYTARERAALAWTEAVTHIATGHVPDTVLEEARRQLSEKELADLTLVVATINAWNRLSIAARLEPGTYQPAAAAR